MSVSSTAVTPKIAATNSTADYDELTSCTAANKSTTRSSTVSEFLGQDYAKASTHAQTVSFSLTLKKDPADLAQEALRAAYEANTPVWLFLDGYDAKAWEVIVSDFSESGSSGADVEISVSLLHTGTTPAVPAV